MKLSGGVFFFFWNTRQNFKLNLILVLVSLVHVLKSQAL